MVKVSLKGAAAMLCAALWGGSASAQSLPSGWTTTDIGAVGAVGTAAGTDGSFTLDGAGADVWGTSDAFRFAYTPLTGDGSIVAQVTAEENVNAWTKAGVMMRDTLSTNARHAFMLVSPGKGIAFQRRDTTAGISEHTGGGAGTAPRFVKLTRAGTTFTGFQSMDGITWTAVGSDTIAMGSTIYVGLAVSSHVSGVLATATFEGTTVEAVPPPPPPVSELRVLHWNAHHGGIGTDGVYNPDRFANYIVQFKPDVVSLNEMDNQSQVDKIVSLLNTKTGEPWTSSYDGRGNAVVSRLPMTGTSVCVVNASVGRKAAHMSVVAGGRTINVWSAHLDVDSGTVRTSEVGALVACGQAWPESRIVAGDFNAQYGTPEMNLMGTTHIDGWTKAKSLGTAVNYAGNCDGCTKNSRIDYVYYSKGATEIEEKSAQVFDTRNASGIMPSDHKPMMVVYTLK